jgi:hypothetical protein
VRGNHLQPPASTVALAVHVALVCTGALAAFVTMTVPGSAAFAGTEKEATHAAAAPADSGAPTTPAATSAGRTPAEHGAPPPSSCVTCHSQLDDRLGEPTKDWERDAHHAAGLGCEACHGGDASPALATDPEAAMSKARGFRPPPDRLHVVDFCGRCHSDAAYMKQFNPGLRVDQLAEYRTSVHGKRDAEGDAVPAKCIDCHGVHGMRPVASPDAPVYPTNVPKTCARCHADAALMATYGIPTDQYDLYRQSIHAAALLERGDTAAPACNSCHGNHGATPPGVGSVANVCGQCHGREAMLFNASFKKDLFETINAAKCTACHSNHRILHPTPELFHSASAPTVSAGKIVSPAPFSADLGRFEAGRSVTASWIDVLRPHAEANDPRFAHTVEITSEGLAAIVLDATVRPGAEDPAAETRAVSSGALTATLSIEPVLGVPVEGGDPIRYRLEVKAGAAGTAGPVKVKDMPGAVVWPHPGSACMSCHTAGDKCDVATEKMYTALLSVDRALREAGAVLREAELKGMEVSRPTFELRSKGTTASVEARALIHTFDTDRLLKGAEQGKGIAAAALNAGKAALAELQYRRKGLAVSLVLVGLVLLGIFLKIRQVDREKARQSVAG